MDVKNLKSRGTKTRQGTKKKKKNMNFINVQKEDDFRAMPIPEEIEQHKVKYQPLDREEFQRDRRRLERVSTTTNLNRNKPKGLVSSSSSATIDLNRLNRGLGQNKPSRNVNLVNKKSYQESTASEVGLNNQQTLSKGYENFVFHPQTSREGYKKSNPLEDDFNRVQVYNSYDDRIEGTNTGDEQITPEPPNILETDGNRVTFSQPLEMDLIEPKQRATSGNQHREILRDSIERNSSVDPHTDKEIEQKVVQTFLKLMDKLQPDSLGDIHHQHLTKILIDDNSGSRGHSLDRNNELENSVERKLTDSYPPESRSEIISPFPAEDSPNAQKINYVTKNVKFPKKLRKTKSKKLIKKKVKLYTPRRKSKPKTKTGTKRSLREAMMRAFERELLLKKKSLDEERKLLREERAKYTSMLQADVTQNNEYLQEIDFLKKDNAKLTQENQKYKTLGKKEKEPDSELKKQAQEINKVNLEVISKKEQEIDLLQSKLQEYKTKLQGTQQETYEKSKADLANNVESLNKEWEVKLNEAVSKANEGSQKSNAELQNNLSIKEEEIINLKNSIASLKKLEPLQEESVQLKDQIRALEKKQKQLNADLEISQNKVSTLDSYLQESEQTVQSQKVKINELETKFWKKDEDSENLRNEIRNLKKQKSQEVRDLKEQITQMEQLLEEAESKAEQQTFDIQDEENHWENERRQNQEKQIEFQREIKQLRSTIEELENEKIDSANRITELDNLVLQLREEKQGVIDTLNDCKTLEVQLKNSIEEKKKQIIEKELEISQIQEDAKEKVSSEKHEILSKQNTELQQRNTQLSNEILALEKDVAELREESITLHSQKESILEEIDQLKIEIDTKDEMIQISEAQYKDENTSLTQKLDEANAVIEDLDEAIAGLKLQLNEKDTEISQLNAETSTAHQDGNERIDSMIKKHDKELENLRNQYELHVQNLEAQHQEQISKLEEGHQREIEQASQQNDNKFEDVRTEASQEMVKLQEDFNQKIARLSEELSNKQIEYQNLQEEFEDFRVSADEKVIQTEQLAEKRSNKLQEDFLKEYQSLIKERDALSEQERKTQESYTQLQESYNAISEEFADVDSKNKELTQSITSLTQKLQESDHQCQECADLKVEKLDFKRKLEEALTKIDSLHVQMNQKDEDHVKEIAQVKEMVQEAHKKSMEDKIQRFKVLAESLQGKNVELSNEIKSKNEEIVEKCTQIHNLETNISQYKDLMKDYKSQDEIEEELENVRYDMDQQMADTQQKHNEEISSITQMMEEKTTKLQQTLDAERQAFRTQLEELQNLPMEGNSQEIESLQKKLDDQKEKLRIEKAKSDSLQKLLEQMQMQ
ncbi:unnamed protein product [Moneuplotes crassus]|uniref:Uncharacterized protein n=1 Tax=Euplotes crassus TaxID=5936 RepID=A0AAD1U4K8_EUPCR|nr:unnamed protein product [Moneuplotes crassus]